MVPRYRNIAFFLIVVVPGLFLSACCSYPPLATWQDARGLLAQGTLIERTFAGTDLRRDPGALADYVPLRSACDALRRMGEQVSSSRQRAFTWTGPYGGGKSSLALILASLLGRNAAQRKASRTLWIRGPGSCSFLPWAVRG